MKRKRKNPFMEVTRQVFLTSTMAGVGEFLCGDTHVTEVELTQVPVTTAISKEHLMVEEEEEPKLVPVTVT